MLLRIMDHFDSLDANIIDMLQADGRRPSVDMARRLKVAEGTVRNRIERLIKDEVIQISAWADPLKIGYQNYAVLMMSVDPRHLERAAEQLADRPEVFFLGTCIGEFNLFVSACFRSLEHMHEFMTKRLSQVRGIQRVSTSHVTRVVKRDYTFNVLQTAREAVPRRRGAAENQRHNDNGGKRPHAPRDPSKHRPRTIARSNSHRGPEEGVGDA